MNLLTDSDAMINMLEANVSNLCKKSEILNKKIATGITSDILDGLNAKIDILYKTIQVLLAAYPYNSTTESADSATSNLESTLSATTSSLFAWNRSIFSQQEGTISNVFIEIHNLNGLKVILNSLIEAICLSTAGQIAPDKYKKMVSSF